MKAIDLFAGLGGWSTGAKMAGVEVIWAANHWPAAVQWHSANHPETIHICQDLHQADWTQVPPYDLLLASPCCQGHSRARGRESGNPQHDSSRSTAWAVVSALECHRPPVAIIENVPEFTRWTLYPAWLTALETLGYAVSAHVVDCADLGVPQNRVRLFLVATKSRAPLKLNLAREEHLPATSFIDFGKGRWTPIRHPKRSPATVARVICGRRKLQKGRFLIPYYGSGSGLTGRSVDRPIGTITTRDRWAIVRGNNMRMLSAEETLAAMTFSPEIRRPASHRLTVHLAGNAVPPVAGRKIIEAVKKAA